MHAKGEIPCKVGEENFLAATSGGISELLTICGVWFGDGGLDRAWGAPFA
jgi:hypothetical protein